MDTPKLSLVTGTMDREASFKRLLDSIIAHTSVSWELVVSDASEKPYSLELPANVRMLEERPKLGCIKGYNRAFAETTGEWVIWLNDDCSVCPEYAETAIAFMEEHQRIGLGALHYSELGSPFHINSAWGVPYANFGIIRRQLGNDIGWFDEDLEMYGCDNSLTFRVLLAGFGIADIPESKVIHHSVKDNARVRNQHSRAKDNHTLTTKYMPMKEQWRSTYRRCLVESFSVPWPHGQRPEVPAVR